MGTRGGPLWQRIAYHLPPPVEQSCGDAQPPSRRGTVISEDVNGSITSLELSASFWDFLEAQMSRYQFGQASHTELPFDFCGGFVGYLGYELKAETCGDNVFQSPYPDASMFLVDRCGLSQPQLTANAATHTQAPIHACLCTAPQAST